VVWHVAYLVITIVLLLRVFDGCHGNNISGSDQGMMFAAAEDFSHLIDDDIALSPGDMIGTGAVSRRDNAGNLQSLRTLSLLLFSFCCFYTVATALTV